MIDRRLAALALSAAVTLALAACSGGGATTAPSVGSSSEAPSAATGGACSPSTAPATVSVTISGFAFPGTIKAKVGDVIGFTNEDGAPHSATLDDGTCTTENLGKGATGSLVFNVVGSYPFHCKIHSDMTGTIEVSG